MFSKLFGKLQRKLKNNFFNIVTWYKMIHKRCNVVDCGKISGKKIHRSGNKFKTKRKKVYIMVKS